jgi:hypothetical protein
MLYEEENDFPKNKEQTLSYIMDIDKANITTE